MLIYTSNYTLNNEGVCWRTAVAVRSQTLNSKDWTAFVDGRLIAVMEDMALREEHALLCQKILLALYSEASNALRAWSCMGSDVKPCHSTMIEKRWRQIQIIIWEAVTRSIVEPVRTETLETIKVEQDLQG